MEINNISKWNIRLILFIIIIIIGFIMFITLKRYQFIGQSLARGDLASTALLFSPEITSSISSLLYG